MATKKYEGKSIDELVKLFGEFGNHHLVPALSDHIKTALGMLDEDDECDNEIIIVADLEEKLFAFAHGDGSELESKDDECVFHIAKDDEFNECMELLNCISNHPENYFNLRSVVAHWFVDAMPDEDEIEETGFSGTIYCNYYYGESEVDPIFEN